MLNSSDADCPAEATNLLRQLPSVDELMRHPVLRGAMESTSHESIKSAIRHVLDRIRSDLLAGRTNAPSVTTIALQVRECLHQRNRPPLRRVINATGIVLHTGLGRAPLPDEAIDAIADVARGYCNLEFDLDTGQRGDRQDHLRELLAELTGAPDALVVNNNAAATFLTLHTLAKNASVVVSRGQLVEIGGSYRMPDIMAAAGCRMLEVGTTNRTHPADYRRAIDEHTRILLHVHTSNYRIAGFTTAVPVAELAQIAAESLQTRESALIVVDDLGSGLLDRQFLAGDPGLFAEEPSVRESLAAGADLVLFSGDKLLGGPQAGIIVGRSDLIARIQKSPLTRTHRPDKLCLAALAATLALYRDPRRLLERLPVARMLAETQQLLLTRAQELANALRPLSNELEMWVQSAASFAGGGALPALELPTAVVKMRHANLSAARFSDALRRGETAVVPRISENCVLLDMRTLGAMDIEDLPRLIAQAIESARAGF